MGGIRIIMLILGKVFLIIELSGFIVVIISGFFFVGCCWGKEEFV